MTQSQMFEQEALPHMAALEKFAYQLCHDPHRSRDLVQETMLKAFSHFDTLFPSRTIAAPKTASHLARAATEPTIRYNYMGRDSTVDDYLQRRPITGRAK